MTLHKLLTCAVAALLLLAFAVPAQANPDACFAWVCDTSNGQCSFDATCSGDTPINYQWTWGDGSPLESILNNPLAYHTYASPTAFSYVTLSVGYLLVGYYDVTCRIQIRNVISPPYPYFFGTCT